MTDIVPLDLETACSKHDVHDESIRQSIENSFRDTMLMMQRNKNSFSKIVLQEADDMELQNPFIHTEDVMETKFSDIRCYSKQYDDSRLRPAQQGEKQCVMGDLCECNLMAIDGGYEDCGFTGVVYSPRYQKCLLCIRIDTMMEFYKRLITGNHSNESILPFTNIVDSVGEYNKEVCIHPNGRNNISGPFVIHQRQYYRYHSGIIEQLPNVNFCTVPNSDENG
tara:strand:- start:1844 stop:2512 length:669 start_codon:yes stop_codon:yes gene_type:complete